MIGRLDDLAMASPYGRSLGSCRVEVGLTIELSMLCVTILAAASLERVEGMPDQAARTAFG